MVELIVLLLVVAVALPFVLIIGLGIYAAIQFGQIKAWEEDKFDYDNLDDE